VSQPYERAACTKCPGKVDHELGEFWTENPWSIASSGHNLSSFERKRIFLNVGGKEFLDISYLTSADTDGDGRSVVAADFRNNGRQDLILRQAGGGPLMLFENNFAQRHYLKVTLRGSKSNRLGVGARLIAVAGGRQIVRELYPANSYMSQMPSLVHFGLGDSPRVDKLIIRWPSGEQQELNDLAADRHIVVTEGKSGDAAIETVVPGKTIRP
jgi:enediyne biosynthesis protein E4